MGSIFVLVGIMTPSLQKPGLQTVAGSEIYTSEQPAKIEP
jgi:hypothetical protein